MSPFSLENRVTEFYTSVYSGYSNRIRGILTVERRKQVYGIPYKINWVKTSLISCDLSDILLNVIKRTDQFGYVLTHRLCLDETDDLTGFCPKYSNPEQRVVDNEYENIPQSIRDVYAPYFKWLEYHPYIVEKANKVVESFGNTLPIGVHYRNAGDWDAIQRGCPYHVYFDAIDTLPKDLPIYLIVHKEEFSELFRKRYGDRIILQPKKQYDIFEKQHTQDVAVESLVLSKLNLMVADFKSTFAETSWWIGEHKANVIRINTRGICK